ncbi:SAM-dependent methyltransferase [Catenuloplanes nepalensis]|uniref:SAM-dependent methyltransferase n=1 Tax=Catenuloplanes nepalensis TaxID=587533 RepID=A0ABT9N1N7_9ACTN|nr:class I SAM-dependent methyltransferase [Catenuloplanes nepalensis]MDP9797356.1 SAM-dependent methyltransferase [Catenuloplanes nepalensis]
MSRCDACGAGELEVFGDLGEIPVLCGVHWADAGEAADSPVGQMTLAACPNCGYVRNVAFDPAVMVYDTTMDTNLHHSPAFAAFSAELCERLADRYDLRGKRILDVGCGQGEFLRELCQVSGASGHGFDAMYAGSTGPDPSGAVFHSGYAPRGAALPEFDLFTTRHWFEHIADPFEFLADLRERAGDRVVHGYIEVPDAGYDLSTAGWEVIYPHVSYFDAYALTAIVERAGWTVEDSGTFFHGMFRYIEISANETSSAGTAARVEDRDRTLAAVSGFARRHHQERDRWEQRIAELVAAGANPVMWGAGSRGVQFLTLADRTRQLAAVVDVNPRKWGRYLPVTAHRVDPPDVLTHLKPSAVIITNPAYKSEIAAQLGALGVDAELLVA